MGQHIERCFNDHDCQFERNYKICTCHAAECLFGMLNYIKDSSRTTLSQENTNHIIRIRHNGPRIGAINIEPYTDKYLEKFERCDPLHVSGKVSKAAKKVKKLESENVYTNIFS